MSDDSLDELIKQLKSIRRAARTAAMRKLQRESQKRSAEMLQYIREGKGDYQSFVLDCLFRHPSKKLIDELSFIAEEAEHPLREDFARLVAETGEMYAVPWIEMLFEDSQRWVRQMVAIGLRNRANKKHTSRFTKRVAPLLFAYIQNYPDDRGAPRYDAFKVFAPKRHANLEAELDRADPSRIVIRQAMEIGDRLRSHRDAVDGFDGQPVGLKYIYSTNYVDADLRNGGISQLYANSTWQLMPEAIEGTQAMGARRLSQTLKAIAYYYHQKGRSKLVRRLPENYFAKMNAGACRSLSDLEDEYYVCFDKLKIESIDGLWKRALDKKPELFQ